MPINIIIIIIIIMFQDNLLVPSSRVKDEDGTDRLSQNVVNKIPFYTP